MLIIIVLRGHCTGRGEEGKSVRRPIVDHFNQEIVLPRARARLTGCVNIDTFLTKRGERENGAFADFIYIHSTVNADKKKKCRRFNILATARNADA